MTREEEIKQAEIKYSYDTLFDGCDYIGQYAKQEAFIAGAKWADEHPKDGLAKIDDVRKWLETNFYNDKYWTAEGDDVYLGDLIGNLCKFLEDNYEN